MQMDDINFPPRSDRFFNTVKNCHTEKALIDIIDSAIRVLFMSI